MDFEKNCYHFVEEKLLNNENFPIKIFAYQKQVRSELKLLSVNTDKTNKFVVVDIKAKKKLKNSVSLKEIRSQKQLSHLALIKQSRLSVIPIDKKSWDIINKMAT